MLQVQTVVEGAGGGGGDMLRRVAGAESVGNGMGKVLQVQTVGEGGMT